MTAQRQLGLAKKQLTMKDDTLQSMQEELLSRTAPPEGGGEPRPAAEPRQNVTRSLSAFVRQKDAHARSRAWTLDTSGGLLWES